MISIPAIRLQNDVRQYVKSVNLPVDDGGMAGKDSACCGKKLVSTFIGVTDKTQVIICSGCGKQFYRVKDAHTTSPYNKSRKAQTWI